MHATQINSRNAGNPFPADLVGVESRVWAELNVPDVHNILNEMISYCKTHIQAKHFFSLKLKKMLFVSLLQFFNTNLYSSNVSTTLSFYSTNFYLSNVLTSDLLAILLFSLEVMTNEWL